MPPSDCQLLAAIQQRDADAFETLAARYREALTRHLRGIVREAGAAEDLLQETLLRLWMRAEQWDGRGDACAWLFRIATNLALNHLRSQRRRREYPLELPDDCVDEDAPPDPAWLIDAGSPKPEQRVAQAEQEREMWRLVAQLPEGKREVFRLVHAEDLDVREVAERLGIPEGTVKSRLYHARKRLALQWHTWEMEGEENA